VKVWIYKGDILPYKSAAEDKIAKEAAMAVGEAAGQGTGRRVVSAGGGRRRPAASETGAEAPAADTDAAAGEEGAEPVRELVHEASPELEKLLQEEEEIERRLLRQGGGEAGHFRDED
jgi:small subunit ribosomal protein S3